MDMVNWYNNIIQNVINASNDGTNLRIGINGVVNSSYSNTIYGTTNISGSFFVNGA